MAQQVLKISYNGAEIVSKPYDFKAFCLIQDVLAQHEEPVSVYTATDGAVSYMFEGTNATDDVIEQLSVNERRKLCEKVWKYHIDAIPAKKND